MTLAHSSTNAFRNFSIALILLLLPGVSLAQARIELLLIAARLRQQITPELVELA